MSYVVLWYRKGPANYVGSLMDYVARGYSPALGRFISADTIVPGAGIPQALNRYAYVLGNVLKLIDPTGHGQWCADDPTRVCTATGKVKEWEDWLREAMAKSRIGSELLANDSDIFESIIWETSPWNIGGSSQGQSAASYGGKGVHFVRLTKTTWDLFEKDHSLAGDTTTFAVAGHEVFHVYQRRRNPDRENVFTTIQMEREATAAGQAMRYGTYGDKAEDDLTPILAGPIEARNSLLAATFRFDRFPAWLAYVSAPLETRHNGRLDMAFTIDLGFSASAISDIYAAAIKPMPSFPSRNPPVLPN